MGKKGCRTQDRLKKRQLPPLQGRREARHPQQVAEAAFSFYRACYSGSSVSEPPGDQHRMNARPLASGSAGRGNRASMTAIRWVVCSGSSGSLLAPALSLSPSDPILRSASATGACAGPVKERARKRRSGAPALPCPALLPRSYGGPARRRRRRRRRLLTAPFFFTGAGRRSEPAPCQAAPETRSEAIGRPVPNATQHRYTDPTVAEKRP